MGWRYNQNRTAGVGKCGLVSLQLAANAHLLTGISRAGRCWVLTQMPTLPRWWHSS